MATLDELHQALIRADQAGNAADAKVFADAIRAMKGGDRAARIAAQVAEDRKRYDPTKDMSTFDKLAAGAGKAVYDTGRGVGQLLGMVSREDVENARKLDAPLMDTGAGMTGNIVGNVAMALAPGGVVAGTGRVLSRAPQAAELAQALMTGGRALMAPRSIPAAAATGAVQGAIQPSTSTEETLANTGIGAGASAALPALVRGGQVARALVDPFSEAGQARIIGRAMNTAAGNDGALALQNLRNAQPLVPGSMPTAGQAAMNPGIAALERTATATDPVAMNEIARRFQQQSTARGAALQGLAPDRAAAVQAREAATAPLYRSAYGQQITETPGITDLMQRPSMQDALARARNLAQEQGQPLAILPGTPAQPGPVLNAAGQPASMTPAVPGSMTGRDAHFIKMGLDDAVNSAPMTGIGGNELNAIRDTRGAFLGQVEQQVPTYGQARQTYAQMSRPVTQADVIQDIASNANFRGDVTPAAFHRAIDDATAQRVTGQANATMAGVMEPGQMQTLENIRRDLIRSDFQQTAGRGVGSDTVQKLAFSNLMDQAGVPSLVRALPGAGTVGGIAQRFGKLAYQDANDTMRTRLAQALLNPQDAAALMEAGVVTPQMQLMVEGLRRGGAGIGAASPYLLNATKE